MNAGFCSVKITPEIGTPIAGNYRADNLTHGVFHDIFSRSVCLRDGDSLCSLTSVDLCAIAAWQVDAIRERVVRATPLAKENVTVAAIHNHSGPTTGVLTPGGERQDVIDRLIEQIADSIIGAYEDLQPVSLRLGRAEEAELPNNRRVWCQDGKIHMNWEKHDTSFWIQEAGPIDPELLTLSFHDPHGSVRGIIVNYTLHPAVLAGDNNLTSADYVGFMVRALSSELPGSPEVLFFNGAEGNVNHINPWDPDQIRGFKEAERIGRRVAMQAATAYASAEPMESPKLVSIQKIIPVPRRKVSEEKIAWAQGVLAKWDGKPITLVDGCPDEVYAQAALKLASLQHEMVEAEVQIHQIGDLRIVTLPGEFFVEYGLRIKQVAGQGRTMVIGLANGVIGYLPTPKAFEEGGYEITLGHQSYLDETAGEIVLAAIERML